MDVIDEVLNAKDIEAFIRIVQLVPLLLDLQ
jgi:hypothetical protein